jgi:acetoin utilization deacetylase AcuC-like enzyme
MSLALPIVWSDRHRRHDPGGEVWIGVRTPGTEVPQRADAIRAHLEAHGAPLVEAEPHDDGDLRAVHDRALLEYLADAWARWEAAGLPTDPGQDRVVPYVFAHPGLTAGLQPAVPTATWARPGYFAYDTMTLIGPGTWEAARAAADAALTATDLVAGERTPGDRAPDLAGTTGHADRAAREPAGAAPRAPATAAYACCRPPGHHVTRSAHGGSCYLKNSAIAAAKLLARLGGPVAVLDIDAHHGNGTQAIFYERADVLTGSVHVDPGTGWFPHFLGFATETGAGPGADANRNLPLVPGAGDAEWVAAVEYLAAWAREGGARALVVALGVDAAGGDPEAPLAVTPAGFRAAGRALGALGLPTVLVQEGGYDLTTIGALVLETLTGVQEGLPRA